MQKLIQVVARMWPANNGRKTKTFIVLIVIRNETDEMRNRKFHNSQYEDGLAVKMSIRSPPTHIDLSTRDNDRVSLLLFGEKVHNNLTRYPK